MAASNNITIAFKGTGSEKLRNQINKLAEAQAELNRKTGKDFPKAAGAGAKGGRLLNNAFATMRSKLLLFNFAMALGIRQLVGFAKESAKLENMSRAFNTLAGATESSGIAMVKLKAATNSTMSDFDLFQQANNAMILGVSKNSDEMAEMFDVAQRLGRALGRDTKSSVESLITGIGRQSRLMLDNIGIIVKADKAYENYALRLNTTADKLTETQRKTAFTEEAMRQAEVAVSRLGREVLSSQDRFDALGATLDNFQSFIGGTVTPVVLHFLEGTATFMRDIMETDLETALRQMQELGVSVEAIVSLQKQVSLESAREKIETNANKIISVVTGVGRSMKGLSTLTKAQKESLGVIFDEKQLSGISAQFIKTTQTIVKSFDPMAVSIETVNRLMGETTAVGEKIALQEGALSEADKGRLKAITAQSTALGEILAAVMAINEQQNLISEKPLILNPEEIDITTLAIRGQTDALNGYAISLVRAADIVADYSDNLNVLSRAFKISSIAQEQQKDTIVSSSFATGMAYDNAGKAAEAAGKQVIQSLIQQAVVTLMADSFKQFGWFGVPLAATAGAVVGSLVGQAGRHWKMEDGGMVGGRRHSQGGTMIEAEQGEFVMSRNAVNAVGVEAMNRINAGGGAGSVNINFTGNVMSQDFIEDEAIPMIKEAIRRGADIGVA